jgi:lipoprotein-releasing system permease protein
MYKLLLSWRYLRTRFIALASIVSVTLGVATLIVVNSVMSGFVDEMQNRLHGILSDVEMSANILGEIDYPAQRVELIRNLLGDDVDEVTCVVRTPALMTFEVNGRPSTQRILLLGIDDTTYGKVTDFEPYLTNVGKRTDFSFALEETGYPEELGYAGWSYRREKTEYQNQLKQLYEERQAQQERNQSSLSRQTSYDEGMASNQEPAQQSTATVTASYQEPIATSSDSNDSGFKPLPDKVPDINAMAAELPAFNPSETATIKMFDDHAQFREQPDPEDFFDPMKDQYTGIILGLAISKKKMITEQEEVVDYYMIRPGDDVQVMFTSVGANAKPVSEMCTVVDFYSSNMHEYDSSFAFMPLSELQSLRGMKDPLTGNGTVSSIQIKLKEGADLDKARDTLLANFPPDQFHGNIQTWQDTQRPLLSAVHMELTILNILLFMIIAVAGFGILATFYMIVVEKTKDIGILKALGAPSSGVMSIFLSYGMALGMVGTGAGIVLGLLFIRYINEIAAFVQTLTGQEIFDPTIYYFSEIPTIVSPWLVLGVAAGAITIAVLAAVLPALRAARLHPVEALRYE